MKTIITYNRIRLNTSTESASPLKWTSFILFLLLSFTSANAANWYVNNAYSSTEDVFTTAAGNDTTGNGSSASPYATLSKAVTMAAAGDVIYMDSGTYLTNSITFGKNLTVIGAGTSKTILSGNNTENIFGSFGAATILTFRSLQLFSYGKNVEGQIFTIASGKTLNLESILLNDNPGDASAGVSFLQSSGSTVNASYSIFKCSGYNADNGGVFSVTAGTLSVSNSVFFNNRNKIDKGGAIEIQGAATVTVTNTSFKKNMADDNGGAIYQNGGTLTVSGSCFDNNMTTGDQTTDGGGAYMGASGTATFTNCTFSNNETNNNGVLTSSTSPDGGAIRISGATASFNTCSFTNNKAGFSTSTLGEDIAVTSGTCNLTNCRFESIYNTYANDVNIYKTAGGTLNMVKSGTTVANGSGVALSKPEINGAVTSTDSLSPDATPTTSCLSLTTDSCGVTSCVTDIIAPSIVKCVDNKTVASCTLLDYRSEVVAYDDCTVLITQSPAAGTLLTAGTTTVTISVSDAKNNTTTCTFTVSVSAPTGGSITGGVSVCPNVNSTTLSLSGNSGTVSKWQYSIDNFQTDINDVSNTTTSLVATNLSVTTYYRAVVTSGSCATANSATATITVSSLALGGFVAGGASVCVNSNNTNLVLSGNSGTITKWQSSTTNDFSSSITDIANTTSGLAVSNLSVTTYYRAVIQAGSCEPVYSSVATLEVTPASIGGSVSGSAMVVSGVNNTVLSLSGQLGDVIKWQSSTVSDFSSLVTDIANTSSSYTVENANVTTYYRAVIQNGNCSSQFSSVATVTVVASGGGGTSGGRTVCSATNSTTLTLSSFIGSIVKWQSSTSSDFTANLTDINETSTSLVVTNLDATKYYRAVVNSNGSEVYSSVSTIVLGVSSLSIQNITGPTDLCGLTQATYSVPVVVGATRYVWTFPAGLSVRSSSGNEVTVNVDPLYITGRISVRAINDCPGVSTITRFISPVKRPVIVAISGPRSTCGLATATYVATELEGGSYNWTVPIGMTIVSGQGTRTITVDLSPILVAGNVGCVVTTNCGVSALKTLVISPSQGSTTIKGKTQVCGLTSVLYTTNVVEGVTAYDWTVPSGMSITSGQGTSQIIVNIQSGFSGGFITVSNVYACGSSNTKSYYVGVADAPGNISGPEALCGLGEITYDTQGNVVDTSDGQAIYSVADVVGATGYNWTVPAGATIVSGQGTKSIVVSFNYGTFNSGVISVVSVSSCGVSPSTKLTVKRLGGSIVGSSQVCNLSTATYYIPFTTGSNFTWTVPSWMTITSGQGTSSINVAISGSVCESVVSINFVSNCGTNEVFNLVVGCSQNSRIQQSQCGITLANVGTTLNATPVTGATYYKFRITNGASTQFLENIQPFFKFTDLASWAYGQEYTVDVVPRIGGVYASNYGCACSITLPSSPSTKVQSSQCGVTLAALNTLIYADEIVGASNYVFKVTNGSNVRYFVSPTRVFSLTNLAGGVSYQTEYTISVSPSFRSGVEGSETFGESCVVTTPNLPLTTKVINSQCGATLQAIGTLIYADPVVNATKYRFEVTLNNSVRTFETINRYFSLTKLPGGALFNTKYSIKVAAERNGVWESFGTACEVSTPVIKSKVQLSQCGITLAAINTVIFADAVPGSTSYRFEVTNNGVTRTFETASRAFSLSNLAGGAKFETSYTVRVSANVNNAWTDYGDSCIVITPALPLAKIQASQCGNVLTNINDLIFSDPIPGASSYNFEVTNGGNVQNFITTSRFFQLRRLAGGAAFATNYSIRVAVLYEGVWKSFGTACTVSTPANTATRIELVEKKEMVDMVKAEFKVSAFPNPFVDSFELQLDNFKEDQVNVSVFDLAGKLIETRVLSIGGNTNQFFGNQYQSGVYNVVISHGTDVKHVRLIKK